MDTNYAPTGTMLDALPNVDVLLARRDKLIAELKPLRARYGGTGNYMGERLFKVEEAKIELAVRTTAKAEGEKPTEGAIEARVRTHEQYAPLLLKELADREKWIELEERLQTLEWRLHMRKTDAFLLGGEARLAT